MRERTLLVGQAATARQLKGQKTNRPPPSVGLLGPLRDDLAVWRSASASPPEDDFVFARADGRIWREHDWRNRRKRIFARAARAIGVASPRAYDLRHSFASLLIHEGRLSIVELAEQLGHNPTMSLSTYAHVMAELRGAPRVSAEEHIEAAQEAMNGSSEPGCGPNAAHASSTPSGAPGRTRWRRPHYRPHELDGSVIRM